jgi:hypothetical protein
LRYDRRQLLLLATGAALACGRREPPPPAATELSELLGLEAHQRAWLDVLDEAERGELTAALAAGGATAAAPRAVALVLRVIGSRSRLFSYLGYPPLDDEPDVCDGLLKE